MMNTIKYQFFGEHLTYNVKLETHMETGKPKNQNIFAKKRKKKGGFHSKKKELASSSMPPLANGMLWFIATTADID